MVLRGWNGLGSADSFDFKNTDTIKSSSGYSIWGNLFRCVKLGTPVDIWAWLISKRVEFENGETIQGFDGVYFRNVNYDRAFDVDNPIIEFDMVIANVHYDFTNGITTLTNQYSGGNKVADSYVLNFRYQQGTKIGFYTIDYMIQNDTSSPLIKCAENSHYLFSSGAIGGGGSILAQFRHFRLNQTDVEEQGDYPIIGPERMQISTDDQTTWYCAPFSGDWSYAVMSWEDMEIVDPQQGDTSDDGGGGGNYGSETSDPIHDDGVPTITAISSGFVKAYNPSATQLLSLRNFLYSDSFIDNVKKLLSNPLEYIISLKMIACSPDIQTTNDIGVGGVSTGVSSPVVANQYKQFDCGSIDIEEKYGGFLDYAPLTKVSIYLPFIGTKTLDTNYVMHSTLSLIYAVDFLTGDCIAKITITNNHKLDCQTYFFDGNCACEVPMSSIDYSQKYMGMISGAIQAGGGIASGNAGAMIGGALSVAMSKPDYERTGHISGSSGMMGNYTPYVMIERPCQQFPAYYNALSGRPSNVSGRVRDFSGFLKVAAIELENCQCTDEEMQEIKQLLNDGVFV